MKWPNKNLRDIENELGTNFSTGLESSEAYERLKQSGANQIAKQKIKPWYLIFLLSFFDPLALILILASVVTLLLQIFLADHTDYVDFVVLICIILINAVIQTIEHVKAQKSLESLQKMITPKVLVKRDNNLVEIPTTDLVVGDLVFLEAGKYVPADIRIINAERLTVDESALTGESNVVEKTSDTLKETSSILADQINMAFMSTIITNGRLEGVVIATGKNTEVGKLAQTISDNKSTKTPLQIRLAKLTRFVSIAALFIAIAVFLFFYFTQGGFWVNHIMISVTIAIAIVPESLLVIVSVILAIASKKMSKQNVIVKKLDAIETLGALNVICTDKTGTLTQNKMQITKIIYNNEINENLSNFCNNNEQAEQFLNGLVLCNDAINSNGEKIGDPTEVALVDFARKFIGDERQYRELHKRIREIPFDSDRKLMSTVNRVNKKDYVYTKGALDELLSRCNKIYYNNEIIDLDETIISLIKKHNNVLANEALRVLGIAYKEYVNSPEIESNLIFIGAVAMIDPPRENVIEAINKSHNAGIRVVMITGDHKDTAFAIAKQLNIAESLEQVISGDEFDKLTEEQVLEVVKKVNVFARVNPNHKTIIVSALQKQGNVVSMTGDGVNDAPSLSKSDVGVAMGHTGTDVAKDAASVILQDDNFATIVSGIQEGRNVFIKLKKAIIFVLAANLAQVIAFLLISFVSGLAPWSSVNVLWFNLVVETLIAIPIGMSSSQDYVMKLRPLNKNESFFHNALFPFLIFSSVTLLATLSTYFIGVYGFAGGNYYDPSSKIATIFVMTTSPALSAYFFKISEQIKERKSLANDKYLVIAIAIVLVLNVLMIFTPKINDIFINIVDKNNSKIPTPLISLNMVLIGLTMIVLPSILIMFSNIMWKYSANKKLFIKS